MGLVESRKLGKHQKYHNPTSINTISIFLFGSQIIYWEPQRRGIIKSSVLENGWYQLDYKSKSRSQLLLVHSTEEWWGREVGKKKCMLPFPPYFSDSGVWVHGKLPLFRITETANWFSRFLIISYPQLESYFTDSINSS